MHDLKYAPNRRVQRAMEKENKKLRDAAKKKQNEVVRVSCPSTARLKKSAKVIFFRNLWRL